MLLTVLVLAPAGGVFGPGCYGTSYPLVESLTTAHTKYASDCHRG